MDAGLREPGLAPQPLLDATGGDDLHRFQDEGGDRAPGPAGDRGAGEPALELPTQPVSGALRGERRRAPPHPVDLRTALDPGGDGQPQTRDPGRGEHGVQLPREPPTEERGLVDPLQGRVAPVLDRRPRGHGGHRRRAPRDGPGDPVRHRPDLTETGGDIPRRERGEVAQRPHAETVQEADQLREHLGIPQRGLHHEGVHGQPRQVAGVPARFQQRRTTSTEHGRGQFVGEPHLTLHPGRGHRVDHTRDDLLDPAVETQRPGRGEHEQTGPEHLDPRHDGVERLHHGLEPRGVPRRVRGDHHELRAAELGLAPTQPATHPHRTGDGVARQHPAGPDHRQRQVETVPLGPGRRDRRPVRAPHRHDPGAHPAATHSAVRAGAARPEQRTTVETEASRPVPAPRPP